MKLLLTSIFTLFLISCGFQGHMPSNSPLEDGIYELQDDNNWPSQSMIWPMSEGTLSQLYSMNINDKHKGIDIASSVGDPIRAVHDGIVVFSGVKYSGYGNMVLIEHNDDLMTVYAHMDKLHVKKGETIEQGQVIGTMGATGIVTGPHLHFEVVEKGYQVNPLDYLDLSKLTRK